PQGPDLLVKERLPATAARTKEQAHPDDGGPWCLQYGGLGLGFRSSIAGKRRWRIIFAVISALAVKDQVGRNQDEPCPIPRGQFGEESAAVCVDAPSQRGIAVTLRDAGQGACV